MHHNDASFQRQLNSLQYVFVALANFKLMLISRYIINPKQNTIQYKVNNVLLILLFAVELHIIKLAFTQLNSYMNISVNRSTHFIL